MNRKLRTTARGSVRTGLLAVGLVLCTVSMASAQTPAESRKIYIGERAIIVDASTGVRRIPTPEEVAAILDFLKPLTKTGPEGLEFKTLADGTRQVQLDGRFDNVVLARPGSLRHDGDAMRVEHGGSRSVPRAQARRGGLARGPDVPQTAR